MLLESSSPSDSEHRSLLFTPAERMLVAQQASDIPHLFQQIEDALANGLWICGWFGFEAGAHFLGLPTKSADLPLAMLGVFRSPQVFDHHASSDGVEPAPAEPLNVAPMPTIEREHYDAAIHQIHEWISAGETYQVNYTTSVTTPCTHDAITVYNALAAQQPCSFGAIINLADDHTILSFSPELFFRTTSSGAITTRPHERHRATRSLRRRR